MEKTEPFVWQLLLQAALIAVNAVFACAEIALISINPAKLEKLAADGSRAAKRLLLLTAKPARFLATIQVGITLAGFLGSAFAAENFSGRLAAALSAAGFPLSETTTAAASLVLVTLTKSTNGLLRLSGIDPEAEEQSVTEEEIRLLLDAGSRRGSIAAGEKEMINNVFEFNDKTAEEVMTHRRDAVILFLRDEDADWERIILENRHGFYPVCGRDADDIRGVLCARDYLGLRDKSRKAVMKTAVREAQLVPNTLAANALFTRMQKRRSHFAVVIDEYGSVDGIVTMNDLLEELVGDLADGKAKAERPPIEKIGNGLWRVSGAASLDRLARETGAALPSGDYDTFAGYVFTVLGRVPGDGEQAEFEDSGLAVRVTGIRDRRLESALVRKARL